VTARPIVVHRRPPLAHHVLGLQIFDEPIDLPLKLLLLVQVDVVRLAGFLSAAFLIVHDYITKIQLSMT
jgi:hypothetical protein